MFQFVLWLLEHCFSFFYKERKQQGPVINKKVTFLVSGAEIAFAEVTEQQSSSWMPVIVSLTRTRPAMSSVRINSPMSLAP